MPNPPTYRVTNRVEAFKELMRRAYRWGGTWRLIYNGSECSCVGGRVAYKDFHTVATTYSIPGPTAHVPQPPIVRVKLERPNHA